MVTVAPKPGKVKEAERFIAGGLPLVMEEPATTAWFGIRLGPTTFGSSTPFRMKQAGKRISGKVAAALMARASELFSEPPSLEKVDSLAAKLPG